MTDRSESVATERDAVYVRTERSADVGRIAALNRSVFPTHAEADLVDALRRRSRPFVSFVAIEDDEVVGHIAFSVMTLDPPAAGLVLGLAPMCVKAERQRRGIGGRLVRAGLTRCRALDAIAVFVLGHANYYPRFGFEPAAASGIACEYDVPTDAFMLLELEPALLGEEPRTARYHPAFAQVV